MTPEDAALADIALDDQALLDELPSALRGLLTQCNGFVAYGGGLHVRAACIDPSWHSLRHAWLGPHAYWRHYRSLTAEDIPFAQDCVGNQFFLRDSRVHRLHAEFDGVGDLGIALDEFFDHVSADADELLLLGPLEAHLATGERLAPGHLLHAYPPLCTREAAAGSISFRAVPADELREYLFSLAAQLRDVPDRGQVYMQVT